MKLNLLRYLYKALFIRLYNALVVSKNNNNNNKENLFMHGFVL
jgi:hypothetical protein